MKEFGTTIKSTVGEDTFIGVVAGLDGGRTSDFRGILESSDWTVQSRMKDGMRKENVLVLLI